VLWGSCDQMVDQAYISRGMTQLQQHIPTKKQPQHCGCSITLVACNRLAAMTCLGHISTSHRITAEANFKVHAWYPQQALPHPTSQQTLSCTVHCVLDHAQKHLLPRQNPAAVATAAMAAHSAARLGLRSSCQRILSQQQGSRSCTNGEPWVVAACTNRIYGI
jgi:hypothetical protein